MSWDDEDFDVSAKTAPAASWEDEAEEDPVMESWEVDEEEEAKKKKAAEDKKAAELKKKQASAKPKKAAAKAGDKKLLDIDMADEKTRREMLRQAELESDLNNAADLFGSLGVANDKLDELTAHPRERAAAAAAAQEPRFTKDTPLQLHPLFHPTNKQEFEKLRKTLAPILTKLAQESSLLYSLSLAIDLIRDLVLPLSVESTRKVISTLNVAQREKEKQERAARLLKAGGTATGGAGKKKAKPLVKTNVNDTHFKKDALDNLDDNYDDFGDDDFM